MQPRVRMYCTRICPYCQMAERLLQDKQVDIEKIRVDDEPALRLEMTRITGQTSVPQIFVGDQHVGGYRELAQLERAGALDALLQNSQEKNP
ncbi:MAG TPA: glutaredoxin 3 [Acidiferrobacteraceae bacterium]|nr:glutaredoxin 3 [Acidiferrobacteraceae bacterium]